LLVLPCTFMASRAPGTADTRPADRQHGLSTASATRYTRKVAEKLRRRTIRLRRADKAPRRVEAAAQLLRDIRGVKEVCVVRSDRIVVQYNVRRITLQIIEALLAEFDHKVDTSLFCRAMRALCYYVEDIECTDGCQDQAANTRDAFIARYLTRPHGCRDPRPEYQKRYL
jgi:hypothetical protein